MDWAGMAFQYGLLFVVLYLVWYIFRGRTASGGGEPRPTVARAGETFAQLVGIFYLFDWLGALLGQGSMGSEAIVGYALVFALEQYLEKLTLFLKGRKANQASAEQG